MGIVQQLCEAAIVILGALLLLLLRPIRLAPQPAKRIRLIPVVITVEQQRQQLVEVTRQVPAATLVEEATHRVRVVIPVEDLIHRAPVAILIEAEVIRQVRVATLILTEVLILLLEVLVLIQEVVVVLVLEVALAKVVLVKAAAQEVVAAVVDADRFFKKSSLMVSE